MIAHPEEVVVIKPGANPTRDPSLVENPMNENLRCAQFVKLRILNELLHRAKRVIEGTCLDNRIEFCTVKGWHSVREMLHQFDEATHVRDHRSIRAQNVREVPINDRQYVAENQNESPAVANLLVPHRLHQVESCLPARWCFFRKRHVIRCRQQLVTCHPVRLATRKRRCHPICYYDARIQFSQCVCMRANVREFEFSHIIIKVNE